MSNEVMSWKDRLAQDAQKQVAQEATDSNRITPKHGEFYVGDVAIGKTVDCVVVAAINERCYYNKPYDPEAIDAPACFAQNEEFHLLAPHENVPEPECENCQDCPQAEFVRVEGQKRPKAPPCKTYKKLALINADAIKSGDYGAKDLVFLKVSPTSVKNWKKYATECGGDGMPVWACGTRISIKSDANTMWQINFTKTGEFNDDETLTKLDALIQPGLDLLNQPYEYEEEEEDTSNKKY